MAADTLSPFVYWGQNNQFVFLKVEIKESTDTQLKLDEDCLDFKANGIGVRGRHDYAFNIEFYLPINVKNSRHKVTDRFIEFQVEKVGIGEIWPRLTVSQKKPAWLKIDFDKFAVDDDSEEDMQNDYNQGNMAEAEIMKKMEAEMKAAKESAVADIKGIWLFIYNLFQWVGYSYVFMTLTLKYMKDGESSKFEALETVGSQLMVCQVVAVLEVIHPMIGIVKTGVLTPLIQVFGRNLMLFVIILPEVRLQDDPWVWWLFIAWSAVEIVRYPFYMLSSIKKESKVITWLRYTVWIPLYPAGFLTESLCIMKAIPMYEMSSKWSLDLPNWYNMSFSFPMFLRCYLFLFLIGMYILLKHMFVQRKKKLGSSSAKSKEKSS